MTKYKNIDEYISNFPNDIQIILEKLRDIIKKTAPNATECISYNMPAFKQSKVLVYFAAYSKHIGFYPTASGIENFQEKLKHYKTSKGAIQFPINEPLPVELISQIVKHRIKEITK